MADGAREARAAEEGSGIGLPRNGFEDVASGLALRARAIELAGLGVPTVIEPSAFELADVFKAALDGDAVGQRVVRELTGHVAAARVGSNGMRGTLLSLLQQQSAPDVAVRPRRDRHLPYQPGRDPGGRCAVAGHADRPRRRLL